MHINNRLQYTPIEYYWYDPEYDRIVERKGIAKKFDDGVGNKGIIMSGYVLENMNKTYTFDHFRNPMCETLLIVGNILTIVIALILYSFNSTRPKVGLMKATLFYVIFMGYITYYMTLDDEMGTVDIELKKLENINQGILSMSFMTGLSIFVLTNIKEKEAFLYQETSFLLIVFMIAIILILFKNNSYIKMRDVTEHRIFKEFIFNYCILLNMFIIINFGINVFEDQVGGGSKKKVE